MFAHGFFKLFYAIKNKKNKKNKKTHLVFFFKNITQKLLNLDNKNSFINHKK